MSVKFPWRVSNSDGTPKTNAVVKLYNYPEDTEVGGNGTFTSNGDGSYYYNVGQTRLYRVRVDGTIKLDNYFFLADDNHPFLTNRNAQYLEVVDALGRFSGIYLESVLTEIPTFAELLSTAAGKGASLVGVRDLDGYYVENTLEGILDEIGPILSQLSGLAADASELNRLDGISSNVTAANLNDLTDGTVSILHLHNRFGYYDDVIGPHLNPAQDSGPLDFTIQSWSGQTDGDGPRGDIVLDMFHPDGWGRAFVRIGNDSSQATLYEICDERKVGPLNFTGVPLLSSIATPHKVDEALKTLANNVNQLQVVAGINYTVIASIGQRAGAADTNAAADPRATTLYYDKSTSYVRKHREPFVQMPQHRLVTVRLFTKGDTAGTSHVKLVIAGQEYEYKIPGATYAETTLFIDLKALPVTIPTFRDWELWLKGDASNAGYIASWVEARVEI